MKKMFKKIMILTFIAVLYSMITFADPPGPPSPGGDPVSGGGVPVGAPIDTGVIVLLFLGIGYAAWKLYTAWNEKKQVTLFRWITGVHRDRSIR
jgi:hypothetical protein